MMRPPRHSVLFLPRQPFHTPGSLRTQLVYACPDNDLTDDAILAVLRAVQFEPVVQRVGGDHESHSAAAEHARAQGKDAPVAWQIKATGAVVY